MDNNYLHIGEISLHWLKGGDIKLDGGTMFGAVPKVLWKNKHPVDENNYIPICNDPILIKANGKNILIDTGVGNKFTEKQQSIFKVSSPWNLPNQLEELGITREDIDTVILTHCDFDHIGGAIMYNNDKQLELTFPNATHLIQKKEWHDVLHPCKRARSTYWPINTELLQKSSSLEIIDGDKEVYPGINVFHTSGHTRGHQIVEIQSQQGESAVHLGDLYPTHAHTNPLWIMAYDNFPLEVIDRKEELFKKYSTRGSWFTFYHDTMMRACKLNKDGSIGTSY